MRSIGIGGGWVVGVVLAAVFGGTAGAGTSPETGDTADTAADTGAADTGDGGDTAGTGTGGVDTAGTGTGGVDTGPAPLTEDPGTGTGTGTVGTGTGGDTGAVVLATGLAREKGGVGCATAGSGRGWLVGLLLVAFGRRAGGSLVAMLVGLLAASSALAADPTARPVPGETPKPKSEIHLLLRGMVERWNEPALATVYKSGTWLAGAGLAVDLLGPIGIDVEVGFGRLKGEQSTLEVAPLSGLVELTAPMGGADFLLAAGPAWTVFTESGGPEVIDGARLAIEARGGLRVDTGLIQPPAAPAPSPLSRLELEVYLARRAQLPGSDAGLRLGAWRASVGLGVVF